MRYDKPCLKSKWKHAHLLPDDFKHVVIDGMEITAKNVWNYTGSREALVSKLVDFFFEEGFKPWNDMQSADIEREVLKLLDADPAQAVDSKDGTLKNTSRLCLDVCREFCQKSFYATKVNGTASILEVYKDKTLLERVLKNRLGWYTTTEPLKLEDGTVIEGEHPYLFDISHKMLVQGCHSSMVSANVSNFRSLVAKYLMSKFCLSGGKVLDLSMGWGARMLAAMSLGLDYYGIDPMTADELESMLSFVSRSEKIMDRVSKLKSGWTAELVKGGSEDVSSYASFPDSIDCVIVCPPYFKLEEYDCEGNSTDMHNEYGDWLESYWHKTVENAKSKMKAGAKFILVMLEKWNKFNLLEDMSSIIEKEGFMKVEEMSYKTTRSHLTDKRISKKLSKSSEKVRIFEKR